MLYYQSCTAKACVAETSTAIEAGGCQSEQMANQTYPSDLPARFYHPDLDQTDLDQPDLFIVCRGERTRGYNKCRIANWNLVSDISEVKVPPAPTPS